jgi:hypothetical protein
LVVARIFSSSADAISRTGSSAQSRSFPLLEQDIGGILYKVLVSTVKGELELPCSEERKWPRIVVCVVLVHRRRLTTRTVSRVKATMVFTVAGCHDRQNVPTR